MHDKVDHSKTASPCFAAKNKAVDGLMKLPVSVTGMLAHGHGDKKYAHYALDVYAADSNQTIGSIAKLLRDLENPPKAANPSTLFLGCRYNGAIRGNTCRFWRVYYVNTIEPCSTNKAVPEVASNFTRPTRQLLEGQQEPSCEMLLVTFGSKWRVWRNSSVFPCGRTYARRRWCVLWTLEHETARGWLSNHSVVDEVVHGFRWRTIHPGIDWGSTGFQILHHWIYKRWRPDRTFEGPTISILQRREWVATDAIQTALYRWEVEANGGHKIMERRRGREAGTAQRHSACSVTTQNERARRNCERNKRLHTTLEDCWRCGCNRRIYSETCAPRAILESSERSFGRARDGSCGCLVHGILAENKTILWCANVVWCGRFSARWICGRWSLHWTQEPKTKTIFPSSSRLSCRTYVASACSDR